jgi:hypothetical protein
MARLETHFAFRSPLLLIFDATKRRPDDDLAKHRA